MKRIFRLGFLALALHAYEVKACDICSCGSMPLGIGDWAQPGSSLIGSSYQIRQFSGNLGQDYIQQYQLNGIWAIRNSWQLKVQVPWMYAHRQSENGQEEKTLNGLGDFHLSGQRLIWAKIDTNSLHNLYGSIGIQLPTGEFENRPLSDAFGQSFQSGSGSWDFSFGLQYEYRWRSNLLVYQGVHQLNTRNKFNYRFGSQWYNALQLGRLKERSQNLSSLIYLSLSHEYYYKDINSRGYYQFGTGGQSWFAGLGGQIRYKSILIRADLRTGLSNNPREGHYQGRNHFKLALNYLF